MRRKKLQEVVDAFFDRERAGGGPSTDGERFYSYMKMVAWWSTEGEIVFDDEKYSSTTSRHLGCLRREAERRGIPYLAKSKLSRMKND